MIRILILVVMLTLTQQSVLLGQRSGFAAIKGTVLDSTSRQPLEAATVSAYLVFDSSMVAYAITDKLGKFTVKNIPRNQQIKLVVSYSGLKPFIDVIIIPSGAKELHITTIGLTNVTESLPEVHVSAFRPPFVMKKDTLEFNANAFKTPANGVVEDLLRQLPGVEVDMEGNITVNGKRVTKITVDGKDFFGSDVKLTSKNLPKDIIERIQVVDLKTREEKFSASRNPSQEKSINIVLKKENKRGIFGRISGAYGSDARYETGANINLFNAKHQLSLIGFGNNTNSQGAPSSSTSITNAGNPGGTNTVLGSAVNYNGEISQKLRLNTNYIYGNEEPITELSTARNNILADTSYLYHSNTKTVNNQKRHGAGFGLEFKPDSATELSLSGSFGLNRQYLESIIDARSLSHAQQELNSNKANLMTTNRNVVTGFQLFFGRRFKKRGRLFTFNVNTSSGDRNGNEYNQSQTSYLEPSGNTREIRVDQYNRLSGKEQQIGISGTWAEPISKLVNLRVSYAYNQRTSISERLAFSKDSTTGEFIIPDSIYSNDIKSTNYLHTPAAYLDLNTQNLTAFLGMSIQHQVMRNEVRISNPTTQRYNNVFPSANITYQLRNFTSVMVNYNGMTQQPSIEQLLPSPNNANMLYIQHGNSALKPSFTHNISMNVQQMKGQRFWNASIGWATTSNLIIEETWFDSVQHSMPINSNGNMTFTSNANYFLSWKSGSSSYRVSLGGGAYFGKNASFTDKQRNSTYFTNLTQRTSFSYSYKNILNLQPILSLSFSDTKYSLTSANMAKFWTKSIAISAQLTWPKRFSFEQFWSLLSNSQTGPGFPKKRHIWNAAATYYVTNDKKLMARITVFDILKQNTSIRRIATPGYVEDQVTNALQRYGHLAIIWNLREF